MAAQLGSDVPFFLRGGAAAMRGRGERLERLPPIRNQWFVILVPPHDVIDKTRRLYGALEPSDFTSGQATERALERWQQRLPLADDVLVNGFSRAARTVFSGLSATWAEAEHTCKRRFFLSGAGPALFALARDRADALRQVPKLGQTAFAARTVGHARAAAKFAAAGAIGYP
jgi:4-diphosphocytidyl-2-C-methyl-D-erythritol kinase